jgi:GDP-L-fucose synthase
MFKNKKVLVTGGTGMIGTEVVDLLLQRGAKVTVASYDRPKYNTHRYVKYRHVDLRDFNICKYICRGQDIVLNLVGVKGSPVMAKERPASFFVPMLQFDTNMMEAARLADVEWYLFTSSVGVYGNFESHEDDLWELPPSKNDWYAGWAKRMGELQAETYKIQYNWDRVSIVRPANVFGRKDNFDPETGMVIPSLITRIERGEDPLVVWGDGSAERDFIYARDVAKICLFVVENQITKPVNAGTGIGLSIRDLVHTIVKYTQNKPEIVFDDSKPTGDAKRVLNVKRLKEELGFDDFTEFDDAIREVVSWYSKHASLFSQRYDAFKE